MRMSAAVKNFTKPFNCIDVVVDTYIIYENRWAKI